MTVSGARYVLRRSYPQGKRYYGQAHCDFVYQTGEGEEVCVPVEHHVAHSPDGFEWGYGGSGPAELARCLLWHYLGAEPAPACYQAFKAAAIATAPEDGGVIPMEDVTRWLEAYEAANGPGSALLHTEGVRP